MCHGTLTRSEHQAGVVLIGEDLYGDRKVAHPLSGRVKDGIAMAAAVPTIPISPRPLTPRGSPSRQPLRRRGPEYLRHPHVQGVVLGHILVHDLTEAMISHAFLVQRHADPHDDTAKNLAARRFGKMAGVEIDILELGTANGELAIFLACSGAATNWQRN